MEALEHKRHTLAHLLAMAAKEFDPGVKMGIGPVTDDGFYYDFQFTKAPTEEDLKSLEQTMRKSVHKKLPMTGREITKTEGEVLFQGQPFKLELLAEYAEADKTLTAYTVGEFTDLCKGGHTENTGDIDPGSFTLSRIAGAYWRGDQKNPMLTRIYGLAFDTKAELEEHLRILEEAKKRDHRKLGKELGLFVFSELVGPGLPLWTRFASLLGRSPVKSRRIASRQRSPRLRSSIFGSGFSRRPFFNLLSASTPMRIFLRWRKRQRPSPKKRTSGSFVEMASTRPGSLPRW